MNLTARRPYWIMLVATVVIAGLLVTAKYTRLCKLEQVYAETNPDFLDNRISSEYIQQNLFKVPLDDIAERMMANKKILKVDLDYDLPGSISAVINDIRPIAMLLSSDGQSLLYVSQDLQTLPVNNSELNWDIPMVTGISDPSPYKRLKNSNLKLVVRDLVKIRDDFRDFYLAISNIDLLDDESIRVNLEGLPFIVETYSGNLYQSMKKLKLFLLEYNPDLSEIKRLDMRSEEQIIAASK